MFRETGARSTELRLCQFDEALLVYVQTFEGVIQVSKTFFVSQN